MADFAREPGKPGDEQGKPTLMRIWWVAHRLHRIIVDVEAERDALVERGLRAVAKR